MRCWPFMYRDRELDQVMRLLQHPNERGVVLAGPAGVGKTKLALQVLERAGAAGFPTNRIAAGNAKSKLPFGAVAMLLPDLLKVPTADELSELVKRLAFAVKERARGRRLVVLIDDAHLLDEGSAMFVHQLAVSGSAFVIATVRSGEPAPGPVVALWKDELTERFDLQRLSDTQVAEVATAYLGESVAGPTSAALINRSKGNMLFLRELIRSALHDGAIAREGGVWCLVGELHPSDRLIELVEARLEGVSPDERAVMELLAVGGPLLDPELALLTGENPIERLEEQGLIATRFGGGKVTATLAHPLYGEVLREQLSATRRRRITRQLAEMIEATGTQRPDDLLRIGTWRLNCGGGRPDLLLAAARVALERFDYGLAERLVDAAIDEGAEYPARLMMAELTAMRKDRAGAENLLAQLWATAPDDAQRCNVALSRIDNALLRVDLGKMFEICDEAFEVITDPDARLVIGARRMWATLHAFGPRSCLEAAELLASPAGGEFAAAYGIVHALSLARAGRTSDALRALPASELDVPTQRRLVGDVNWPTLHDVYYCEVLGWAGRFTETEQIATAAYQRSADSGAVRGTASTAWLMSVVLADRGRVRNATRYAREACALLENLDDRLTLGSCLLHLAYTSGIAGDAEAAAEAISRFEALELPEALRWHLAGRLHAKAWTAVAHGDMSLAGELFEQEASHSTDNGDLARAGMALHGLVRIEQPRQAVDRLLRLAAEMEGDLVVARADHAVALADRDPERLHAVSVMFETMGADLLAAECSADAAVLWLRSGDTKKAAPLERRAIELADRCDGARTPALSSVSARSRLTKSEWDTAVLASEGHSNKQIAAAQGISIRTVESRLQHTYTKLGISRRVDLAASLRRIDKRTMASHP